MKHGENRSSSIMDAADEEIKSSPRLNEEEDTSVLESSTSRSRSDKPQSLLRKRPKPLLFFACLRLFRYFSMFEYLQKMKREMSTRLGSKAVAVSARLDRARPCPRNYRRMTASIQRRRIVRGIKEGSK